ncbi:hypothetical protein JXI42_14595, partial [bacterium]|nr:hypothetical protein [bacterium]
GARPGDDIILRAGARPGDDVILRAGARPAPTQAVKYKQGIVRATGQSPLLKTTQPFNVRCYSNGARYSSHDP